MPVVHMIHFPLVQALLAESLGFFRFLVPMQYCAMIATQGKQAKICCAT